MGRALGSTELYYLQVPEQKLWRTRGYLPHIEPDGATQFLTWRTADALPAEVIEAWQAELRELPESDRKRELARRAEQFCDSGHGECLLGDPRYARVVQETLLHDHGRRYLLRSWVVMPNHVHAVLTPLSGVKLETIMRVVKSVSATKIHKMLGREGQFWFREYYDRFMRGEDHLERTCQYIEWNPVKAGLCNDPKHWQWSSANEHALARLEALSRELSTRATDAG